MTKKCPFCKLEIEAEDLEKHKFECASSYQDSSFNFENKIPCEICQELIDFDKYSDHISICSQPTGSIPFLLGRFNSTTSDFFRILNIPQPPNMNSHIYNPEINPDDMVNENIDESENLNSSEEVNLDVLLPVPNEPNDFNDANESNELNPLNEQNENIYVDNQNSNLDVEDNSDISRENANTMEYNINLMNYNMNLINTLLRNSQFRNEYVGDTYESLSVLDENVIKQGLDVEKVSEIYLLVEPTKCPICLEDFEEGEKFRKIKCKHTFCDECLEDWLEENKKCPVCMIEIE